MTTSKMTFRFNILRNTALMNGHNSHGPVYIAVDVANFSPEMREMLSGLQGYAGGYDDEHPSADFDLSTQVSIQYLLPRTAEGVNRTIYAQLKRLSESFIGWDEEAAVNYLNKLLTLYLEAKKQQAEFLADVEQQNAEYEAGRTAQITAVMDKIKANEIKPYIKTDRLDGLYMIDSTKLTEDLLHHKGYIEEARQHISRLVTAINEKIKESREAENRRIEEEYNKWVADHGSTYVKELKNSGFNYKPRMYDEMLTRIASELRKVVTTHRFWTTVDEERWGLYNFGGGIEVIDESDTPALEIIQARNSLRDKLKEINNTITFDGITARVVLEDTGIILSNFFEGDKMKVEHLEVTVKLHGRNDLNFFSMPKSAYTAWRKELMANGIKLPTKKKNNKVEEDEEDEVDASPTVNIDQNAAPGDELFDEMSDEELEAIMDEDDDEEDNGIVVTHVSKVEGIPAAAITADPS